MTSEPEQPDHRDSAFGLLSSVIDDADAHVEEVVRRCLRSSPEERPISALAVAAALPGGDPLTEVLASGETPSPEIVAAAGGTTGLSVPAAVLAVVVGAVCLLAVAAGLDPRRTGTLLSLTKKPEAFEENAREIVGKLAYTAEDAFTSYGFSYLRSPRQDAKASRHWINSTVLEFWYRQAPQAITPGPVPPLGPKVAGEISLNDPPPIKNGMLSLRLNPQGDMVEFLATTPREINQSLSETETDWSPAFASAGLSYSEFAENEMSPKWSPPTYADVVRAWQHEETVVEAASFQGKLVYFQARSPGTEEQYVARHRSATQSRQMAVRTLSGAVVLESIFLLIFIVSAAVAIRNVRLRRVDKKGVWKLAIYLMVSTSLVHLLQTRHYPDLRRWVDTLSGTAIYVIPRSLRHVIYYMALEPYVRKYWPNSLISWSRLLAGRYRDARVGRDFLLGWAFAGCLAFTASAMFRVLMWIGASSPGPIFRFSIVPQTVLSTQHGIASLLFVATNATTTMLFLLWSLCLFRLVFRRAWLGNVLFTLFWTTVLSFERNTVAVWLAHALWFGGFSLLIERFGLLTGIAAAFFFACMISFPLTTDLGAWYASRCVFPMIVMTALILFGFYHAIGGRPRFQAAVAAKGRPA